jgi:hypothetical protein
MMKLAFLQILCGVFFISHSWLHDSYAQAVDAQTSIAQTADTQAANPVPSFKNVVWIWLENTAYADMINQNYVNTLIENYPTAILSAYSATSTITQANTFAMISGNEYGVKDNNRITLDVTSIVNLLEAKSITWKVYADSFQGSCYLGPGTLEYKRYRTPFLSLSSVQDNRFLCSNVLTFQNLEENTIRDLLPQVSIVIPGLAASGASTDAGTADQTLRQILEPMLAKKNALDHTTIFISTINALGNAPLFAMVIGAGVNDAQSTISSSYNHYHLLRTIELGLKLGHLNQSDSKANPILGFWK